MRTGLEALRRVLSFAAVRDLETLRPAQVADSRRTVAVVAAQAGVHGGRRLVIANVRTWLPQIEVDLPWGTAPQRASTVKALADLQRAFKAALDNLFPRQGMGDLPGVGGTLPVAAAGVHLQRVNIGDASPVELWFTVRDWRSAFWLSAAGLLEQWGSQLRRCPKCSALYVKVRRQAYCSPRCSGAARAQRWYRAHRRRKRALKSSRLIKKRVR